MIVSSSKEKTSTTYDFTPISLVTEIKKNNSLEDYPDEFFNVIASDKLQPSGSITYNLVFSIDKWNERVELLKDEMKLMEKMKKKVEELKLN